jgi:hypothetical protein
MEGEGEVASMAYVKAEAPSQEDWKGRSMSISKYGEKWSGPHMSRLRGSEKTAAQRLMVKE